MKSIIHLILSATPSSEATQAQHPFRVFCLNNGVLTETCLLSNTKKKKKTFSTWFVPILAICLVSGDIQYSTTRHHVDETNWPAIQQSCGPKWRSRRLFSRSRVDKGRALVNWKTTTCLQERTYFLKPPFRDLLRSGHCTGKDRRKSETETGRDIWVVNLSDNATGELMEDDPNNEFSGWMQGTEAAPQLVF